MQTINRCGVCGEHLTFKVVCGSDDIVFHTMPCSYCAKADSTKARLFNEIAALKGKVKRLEDEIECAKAAESDDDLWNIAGLKAEIEDLERKLELSRSRDSGSYWKDKCEKMEHELEHSGAERIHLLCIENSHLKKAIHYLERILDKED